MPSADFCPPIDQPLGCSSTRQVDRSPRVRRVTFRPSPPHIHRLVPDDFGLRTPTLPHPQDDASHAVRVPRARRLPSASFRFHLAVDTLAVRLGVPVIRVSKGLSPSSHFPAGFRLPVASARQGATRHAWRTSGSRATSPPPRPLRTVRATFTAHGSSLEKALQSTRRSTDFAPIGADSLHCQELGRRRVGEQALQTPHTVPLACSDRLHDTGL